MINEKGGVMTKDLGPLTEFSGYGRYGICTYVHSQALTRAVAWLAENDRTEKNANTIWDKDIVTDSRIRIGNNECLHRLERKEEDQEQEMLCLGWNLQNGADSFDSISRLLHILWVMQESAPSIARSRDFMGLTVHITRTTNGYGVGANFSEAVWELIESPFYMFEQIELPLINREIQCAFEEKVNKPVPGQYATIFEGRDGATLQILQPHGSGVWIAGSHKKAFEYQLTDHNTDTSLQALMHVIGLCTVLKYCRTKYCTPLTWREDGGR
jgi:hypothetical protein